MEGKTMEKLQRFSIRKLSIGAVSCMIGTVTFLGYSNNVQAAEKPQTVETTKAENEIQPESTQESKPNEEAEGGTQNDAVDKNAIGSQANNAAVVNASDHSKSVSDQSKSEDSSAVASTSERKQLQTSQSADTTDVQPASDQVESAAANSNAPENNGHAVSAPTALPKQPAIATKLVRRPVMRLAAATATNSDELLVGKDVTVSDFSVTAANGKNEFEKSHANIKFTMHADDPSALVGKRLTIQLDNKVWNGINYSETKKANSTTISYQGQVIGTLDYGSSSYIARITFNNHVKDYTKISVQPDLVVSGPFQDNLPYEDYLYTPTQAKDDQTYHLTNDIVIGQQKYSSNLPSVIHYRKLESESVSSVTNETTTSYNQGNSELYAGTFYKTPDGIYYSQSSYYSGNNLYDKESGQPGYLESLDLFVGTDMITDRTRSYTATFDIDQTKLSPDKYAKLVPIDSYYLIKYYWDDEKLLPNTSDVYVDYSSTYSSTTTADAKVTKNSVIFNQLNGQSLATQELSFDDGHMTSSRDANYIRMNGNLDLMPALFKQLQAVAESDQNLTEAINTVTTTGRGAEIKLANPVDTGFKVTIATSDGKTKEVPWLIDTIGYEITTASTAPKGAILVAAQGKTAKVYHPGDQNIPAVVDQSQLTKTITRTINVHEPGKSVTTTKQTVTLTQSVSVVDGKDVTYNGDWKVQGDSQWASYDVPSVPGYTASQSHVVQQEVTDATQDQTVNITYTANEHQISIEYVDNATGHVVKTDHLSGKTSQTVSITPHVPDGWELVSGQSVPSKVTLGADGAPATVIKVQPQERSVTVKFVDDQSFDWHGTDYKTQVGQAVTVTGRDGDTVDLKLTVPDKYKLADGQQLPTTYTFKKDSGDVTIHLVHQVVQREATINVKLGLETLVHAASNGYDSLSITQTRWKQLEEQFGDEIKYGPGGPDTFYYTLPSVEAGALTGHVSYDLVDNRVVSFGDDWTSLNLDGHTYQLPNGTEVVNGVMLDDEHSWGKKFKEEILKHHPDVDPDYANRPWHGYLSVNATNNSDNMSGMRQLGLAGDEPNALAKAIGDRAATAVEMSNKPIDFNFVQQYDLEFNEQDGQLRADVGLPVVGVYIPYVEKTATRTINVTTPDGKTTAIKQTATLAKQVDFGKDAHPAWTISEWSSYEVPTIPGYTASQSNVAKEAVTGTTEDQTVNITYQKGTVTQIVHYVDIDGHDLIDPKDDAGQAIKDSKITGVIETEQNVPIPAGWVLVDNTDKSVTLPIPDKNGEMPILNIKIKHAIDVVAHDHYVAVGSLIDPAKPNGARNGAGMDRNDLNQLAVRKIHVVFPNSYEPGDDFLHQAGIRRDSKNNFTITQTVGYMRDGLRDRITGKLVGYRYTNGNNTTDIMLDSDAYKTNHGWMLDIANSALGTYINKNGVAFFKQVNLPKINGYSCHIEKKQTVNNFNNVPHINNVAHMFTQYFVNFMALPAPKHNPQIVKSDTGLAEQSVKPANTRNNPAIEKPKNPIVSENTMVKAKPDVSTLPNNRNMPTGPATISHVNDETAINNTGNIWQVHDANAVQQNVAQHFALNKASNRDKHADKHIIENGKAAKMYKNAKIAKLNSNKVNAKPNSLAQPKLEKVQESTNRANISELKHDVLPQTGEKHNNLMAMLGLVISGLGMIGAMKSKRRKDN